jgi:hypothetical protein
LQGVLEKTTDSDTRFGVTFRQTTNQIDPRAGEIMKATADFSGKDGSKFSEGDWLLRVNTAVSRLSAQHIVCYTHMSKGLGERLRAMPVKVRMTSEVGNLSSGETETRIIAEAELVYDSPETRLLYDKIRDDIALDCEMRGDSRISFALRSDEATRFNLGAMEVSKRAETGELKVDDGPRLKTAIATFFEHYDPYARTLREERSIEDVKQ